MQFGNSLNLSGTQNEIQLGDVGRGGIRRISQVVPETSEYSKGQGSSKGLTSQPMGLEESPEVDWTNEKKMDVQDKLNDLTAEFRRSMIDLQAQIGDEEFLQLNFQKIVDMIVSKGPSTNTEVIQ